MKGIHRDRFHPVTQNQGAHRETKMKFPDFALIFPDPPIGSPWWYDAIWHQHNLTPVLLSLQHVIWHDITQHDTCMLVCMYIMTNTTTVIPHLNTLTQVIGVFNRDVTNRVVYQYCPHGITLPGKIPWFFPDIVWSFPKFPDFPWYFNQILKFPDFFPAEIFVD